MTNEEIIKAEQIKEVIRQALNQLLDEEYEEVLKRLKDGDAILTNKSLDEIKDDLMSPGQQ